MCENIVHRLLLEITKDASEAALGKFKSFESDQSNEATFFHEIPLIVATDIFKFGLSVARELRPKIRKPTMMHDAIMHDASCPCMRLVPQ